MVRAGCFALVVPAAIVVSGLGAAVPAWHSGAAAPVEPLRRPALSPPQALSRLPTSSVCGDGSLVAVANLVLAVLVLSVLVGVALAFSGGVAHCDRTVHLSDGRIDYRISGTAR